MKKETTKKEKRTVFESIVRRTVYEVPVSPQETRMVVIFDNKTDCVVDAYVHLAPPYEGYCLKVGSFPRKADIDLQEIVKEAQKFEKDPFKKTRDMLCERRHIL